MLSGHSDRATVIGCLVRGVVALLRRHLCFLCEQTNRRTRERPVRSFARSPVRLFARSFVRTFGGVGAQLAVRYRTWLIREFREIKEFRDVRAMPATNQVSDVVPLNRAARSRASLNSLISLNSLNYDAPKRDEFMSEGVRCGAIPKAGWMGVYLGVHPHSDR